MRLFSTEQVSRWHPDKMADQISDAILTACLKEDPEAHVACECLLKGNDCIIAGEITTTATVDFSEVAKRKLAEFEPWKEYKITNLVQKQSAEINLAVNQDENIGAGDQGIMFGYATAETKSRLPYGFDLANRIIKVLERITEEDGVLKGDAKTQVTVDLDKEPGPDQVETIVISACQHDVIKFEAFRIYVVCKLQEYIPEIKWLDLIQANKLLINPAGKWTLGGPDADAGLTGRKIVCDQYGGYCPVGGGAFSGKDPTKVDRSGSYMARKIAVDLLEKYQLKWCEVQIGYAIGIAQPVSVSIKNDKELDLDLEVAERYDLTPRGIINYLGLLKINYEQLASGCHYYSEEIEQNIKKRGDRHGIRRKSSQQRPKTPRRSPSSRV